MEDGELRRAQMALSIEVLFHLVEDEVYETYLNDLFRLGVDYVVIMRSNCHEDIRLKGVLESVWKDRYSDVLEKFDDWVLMDFLPPQKHPHLFVSQTSTSSSR